ncbi:pyridoxamine 5'-phosphate oxidase family protein [Kribbella shirazensis]|uniref:Pyridoxamine 5'-phosphate oxidase family protein n=1 Tax=Kribbella shirazensis TaxID=1105143 RepID=A0A7X6A6J0_9ACTN|nr:pyridoxamine 5'-phosphate oxidase family protein [Kribbella shirazensis]NIK62389.1 hypothetical protein [Kribbella shirazensis]
MFHPGESSVQRRAGIVAAAHGSAAVDNAIPEIAEQFLRSQHLMVISAEYDGQLWTSLLTGVPGFITVSGGTGGETGVRLGANWPVLDPLAEAFRDPRDVGMIAIEPETRRRVRINGRAHADERGLYVQADQVLANCPKYIQVRRIQRTEPIAAVTRTDSTQLSDAQVAWIRQSDTFFVGTGARGLGNDASHRGGSPGFVDAASGHLSWPDYVGNSMYMTFGNLALDPRVGLLFWDFDSGATLHVSGTATVDWDERRAARHPGAQRMVDVTVERVVQLDGRVPLRWEFLRASKFNPRLERSQG